MPAQPAQPLLASTLSNLHKARRDDNNDVHALLPENEPVPRKRRKLETGWKEVDGEVLRGGLDYGEGGIVCLSAGGSGAGSGDDGEGLGDELAYSTLASHVLTTTSPPPAQNPAFYIDTLGTFSPHRLHNLLCTRLRQPDFTHQGGYVYHKVDGLVGMTRTAAADMNGKGDGESAIESVEEKAAKLLDRVKIMRCFDFRGLMECIGEVGAALRELERDEGGGRGGCDDDGRERGGGGAADVASGDAPEDAVEMAEQVDNEQAHITKTNAQQAQAQKLEILDSQADDFDDDEDLLLDDYLVNLPHTIIANNNNNNDTHIPSPHVPPPLPPPPAPTHHHEPHRPQTLLILPSLPRLLSPLMHANHVKGHALLTHLLRSLRHLTSSHALCVLILNSVVGVPSTYTKQSGADEGVSVFGENGGMRPALGKTFSWGVDLSLMGSFVGGGGGKRVVEVVGDRFGGRVGRWSAVG